MNPVPHTISHLLAFKYLAPHRQSLFTVLKELYSNALEHGAIIEQMRPLLAKIVVQIDQLEA